MKTQPLRYIYAADRAIGVDILRFLNDEGVAPLGLIVPDRALGSHVEQLEELCPDLPTERIWRGAEFRSDTAIQAMCELAIDYILSIHFPLIYPMEVLQLPRHGVVNLHPAFLPYNRGWHNSVWALLDNTPYGATLHFMNERVDAGDIIHQKQLEVKPEDTADSLYKRALALEYETFVEAWPDLRDGVVVRKPQDEAVATHHFRKDLARFEIGRLDLNAPSTIGAVIQKLRALTTNRLEEAAYFEADGARFRIQVQIVREPVRQAAVSQS